MPQNTKVVVQGISPELLIQSGEQSFCFDNLCTVTNVILQNNFIPTQQIPSSNNLIFENSNQKGIALLTKQSALVSWPVMYIASWYKATNPNTELLEIFYDNILEMGVTETEETVEPYETTQEGDTPPTQTVKTPYIKAYGNLNMQEHKITNLADPTDDLDAVNKRSVDTAIAAIPKPSGGGALPSGLLYPTFITAKKALVGFNDRWNNPYLIANPWSQYMLLHPYRGRDTFYVFDGTQWNRQAISDIFGEATTYNIKGWYDATTQTFWLVNIPGPVTMGEQLFYTTKNFTTYTEVAASVTSGLPAADVDVQLWHLPACGKVLIRNPNLNFMLYNTVNNTAVSLSSTMSDLGPDSKIYIVPNSAIVLYTSGNIVRGFFASLSNPSRTTLLSSAFQELLFTKNGAGFALASDGKVYKINMASLPFSTTQVTTVSTSTFCAYTKNDKLVTFDSSLFMHVYNEAGTELFKIPQPEEPSYFRLSLWEQNSSGYGVSLEDHMIIY